MILLNKIKMNDFSDDEGSHAGTLPATKEYFSARQLGDMARGETLVKDDRCKCHPKAPSSRFYFMSKGTRNITVWSTW